MPWDLVMRALFLMVQALDGFDNTASNVAGRLPMQIAEAGFTKVEERQRIRTILGSLSVYRAVK